VNESVCGLIPAAGRGTRLGLSVPKLLAPIGHGKTVWTILRRKLLASVDQIHLIVAPEWAPTFQSLLADDPEADRLSVSVQEEPRGMGDAIFGAYPYWEKAHTVVVVWGDQVHISEVTLRRALSRHQESARFRCTIPTVFVDRPYVQYVFDENDQMIEIRETREGAVCDPQGFSDVGTFVLDVEGVLPAWQAHREAKATGAKTGEVNFLPLLPYLARNGWQVTRVPAGDPIEARGINNIEDLRFFQQLYGSEADMTSLTQEQL
jgi:bifunctional UDP-N-acetylglucosamine pyrophosphorylase / glucosamine-1-phosphate N-acetyltransferase